MGVAVHREAAPLLAIGEHDLDRDRAVLRLLAQRVDLDAAEVVEIVDGELRVEHLLRREGVALVEAHVAAQQRLAHLVRALEAQRAEAPVCAGVEAEHGGGAVLGGVDAKLGVGDAHVEIAGLAQEIQRAGLEGVVLGVAQAAAGARRERFDRHPLFGTLTGHADVRLRPAHRRTELDPIEREEVDRPAAQLGTHLGVVVAVGLQRLDDALLGTGVQRPQAVLVEPATLVLGDVAEPVVGVAELRLLDALDTEIHRHARAALGLGGRCVADHGRGGNGVRYRRALQLFRRGLRADRRRLRPGHARDATEQDRQGAGERRHRCIVRQPAGAVGSFRRARSCPLRRRRAPASASRPPP